MDLYEAIIRTDSEILKKMLDEIDSFKRFLNEHQIRTLRALLNADIITAKHDLEKVKEALRHSYEEEVKAIVG